MLKLYGALVAEHLPSIYGPVVFGETRSPLRICSTGYAVGRKYLILNPYLGNMGCNAQDDPGSTR